MTSLEKFLNETKENSVNHMEPASGSFSCQDKDCDEIVYEGFIDELNDRRRLNWICSAGHKSSVVI